MFTKVELAIQSAISIVLNTAFDMATLHRQPNAHRDPCEIRLLSLRTYPLIYYCKACTSE